jgi:hypothetical protein
VRTVNRLREHGVPPERTLAVLNRSARTAKGRAELTRGVADLLGGSLDGRAPVIGPVHVAERRGLDEVLRDGARLPSSVVDPVAGAVSALLSRTPQAALTGGPAPVAVVPGSLGAWAEEGVG